jgi:hypothetical protein
MNAMTALSGSVIPAGMAFTVLTVGHQMLIVTHQALQSLGANKQRLRRN